ncbi:MAG: amino acid permease [Verrucomicrobia bacterium]|nr:amino acid permease [Verrucomicrobiota bacterium]
MTKKTLGFFQLVMINVIAVDTIRTLPFAAEYGFTLVFFYLVAGALFFIPSALVSAELGTGWPNTGGIYVWVREAFGKRFGFLIIWLNWIYNLFWYPTIMALVVGAFAYLIDPALATNKVYMASAILISFWGLTLLNCLGMRFSSVFSTVGSIVGTLLPMTLVIILGIIWITSGHPTEISFSASTFFPRAESGNNIAFLSNILFGLLGLEMAATHAAEMRDPLRDYPKSLFTSVFIILGSMIFASLAIAIVVPRHELSLVTGIMQAFAVFVDSFNLPWLLPSVAFFIILGGLSSVAAWIIGPTKGIMVASRDGSLPIWVGKTNNNGVPITVLLMQGLIVSVLCLVFVFMPTVNSSFWLLSAMTAQLALIVYIALFAAGIKLHYRRPDVKRSYKIPGGNKGIWIVCSMGIFACLAVIILGFIPPKQMNIKSVLAYELTLIGGIAILCAIPMLIKRRAT